MVYTEALVSRILRISWLHGCFETGITESKEISFFGGIYDLTVDFTFERLFVALNNRLVIHFIHNGARINFQFVLAVLTIKYKGIYILQHYI